MNIFYLDNDTEICAQQHPNKHVVKMILETAQLLSTAHRALDNITEEGFLYKTTHLNHPCGKWCRATSENYSWLASLLISLNDEYTFRYGKQHKVRREGLEQFLCNLPKNIPVGEFYEPPQCMPDECKNSNTIVAYQDYYNLHKSHLLEWKCREAPSWATKERN